MKTTQTPPNTNTDFTGFVFLTTTYEGRMPLLLATLTNVMNNVTNAEFVVQWYEDDIESLKYATHILGMLAKATNNTFTLNLVSTDRSVANTKTNIGNQTDLEWFVNLDDDLIIPAAALYAMKEWARVSEVVTIGVMDGDNTRGFKDFDETKYESFEAFCLVHPPGKAKHHYFALPVFVQHYKWISQLYCMAKHVYYDEAVWTPILERFTTKGVRGYDICLENRLAELNMEITLISGKEAIHLGLEHGYLGGGWNSADTIARTVVETKDGYVTTQ